jgi:hypothetical protein
MRHFETNLHGRLRNTLLAYSHGLRPLFEAVVNSIHAIEDAQLATESGRIRVLIERHPAQGQLIGDEKKREAARGEIAGFKVTDNGIGFTEENYQAFMTLDTERKLARGGRGIGRLLWLKAFDRVEITSRFLHSGKLWERALEFGPTGVTGGDVTPAPHGASRETTVRLIGFDQFYRVQTRKTGDGIANAMLEHCLWYFIRPGGAPPITVEDERENISLDEMYHLHMHSSAVPESANIKGEPFDLLHVKLRTGAWATHSIAYCADNRLVREEKFGGRVPGLHGPLVDEQGQFNYLCYVSSPLLNRTVRPERSSFDVPADVGDLFEGTEVSWEDIRSTVAQRAGDHLAEYLRGSKERAQQRIQSFVAYHAPRYRPIVARMTPEQLNIDPDISDKRPRTHTASPLRRLGATTSRRRA